ncbi:hypothetical protein C8F01DRAFT_291348 [Mycena amicta]|nr:hypothetical protein C8F01DRAFT_291348 [Mycena amicta]
MAPKSFSDLPFELGSMIFEYTLVPSPTPLRRTQAPLLLTGICREWRRAAVHTASLWTTIFIRLHDSPKEPPQDPSSQLEYAATWLHRARTLPLSFVLQCHHAETGERLLQAIMPYHERWKDISLTLNARALLPLATAWMKEFPKLRSLTVRVSIDPESLTVPPEELDLLRTCKFSFTKAPELLRLSLDHFPFDRVRSQWSQMHDVRFNPQSSPVLSDSLCAFQNLRHLTFLGSSPPIAPEDGTLVNLPLLETCELRNIAVVQLLDLPALRRLRIPAQDDNPNAAFLKEFVEQRAKKLTALELIVQETWDPQHFNLPQITELCMLFLPQMTQQHLRDVATVFEAEDLIGDDPLLPTLSKLQLDWVSDPFFSRPPTAKQRRSMTRKVSAFYKGDDSWMDVLCRRSLLHPGVFKSFVLRWAVPTDFRTSVFAPLADMGIAVELEKIEDTAS